MGRYHDIFFNAILEDVAKLKDKHKNDKETFQILKEIEKNTEILEMFEEEKKDEYTSSLED